MPNEPLLSLPQAARHLGITERQLRGLVERRLITYHDVGGRRMFRASELDQYLELIRVEAQS